MGSGTTALAIIAIAIIAIALFSSQIMVYANQVIAQLKTAWDQITGHLGNSNNNGTVSGYIAIGFHIDYADGTGEDVNPNMTFSILPLSITTILSACLTVERR